MSDPAATPVRRPPPSLRIARALVSGRWVVIGLWAVITVGCLVFLPSPTGGGGGLRGLLSGDSPAVATELRSVELFGFPLISRTVVVQRDEDGISPYAQARTVVRAVAVDRGQAGDVAPVVGALPLTNTLGLFPGAREADTTSLTYLLFPAETPFWARTRAAQRYAERFFDPERDHVVGVTGSAPARSSQGAIIRDALPTVETITVIAIAVIVGVAFRSVVAPLLALGTAGVSLVITLRLSAYLADRFDLASPDELEPVVVALLLGVVTDYVIFFCSSMRELATTTSRGVAAEGHRVATAATVAAIARSGPIVAVAGLAVAAGTATLLAAESPFFRALGPALAFTVLVGLVVAVTLVPAVLAVLGDRVFWPSRREVPARAPRWRALLRVVPSAWPRPVVERVTASRRGAAVVLVVTIAGLASAASLVLRLDLGVSFVGALPPEEPVRATAASAQAGFADGILSPTVLLLEGEDVADERRALRRLGESLSAVPGVAGVLGPGSQPRPVERRVLTTADGDAARYLVILDDDPLGAASIRTVNRIRDQLPELTAQAGVGGVSASLAGDSGTAAFVVEQTQDDLVRIAVAAVVANLLMLLVFLRALVASVCLLATTLLSLGATLGLTGALFERVAPDQGLTFYVPFAAAVLLLAFGSDYNIFTVGHVWNGARGRTMRAAIRTVLPPAVGAVFTAGLALGGSFALLSLVPLTPFRQLAFAVGLGIVIEILVVRLLVLPALLTLLGPWAAWPGGRFGSRQREHGPEPRPAAS
ncbi:MMPL family transporter [Nocardioides coralli]|uniref:MMPL family transporter n=1 Tax=Nocardioides coralli TaxID=2872154 RepID=UPI001CA4470F|nr:MMPL family transporter [Nocardioides coralli]QZY29190.1 MMPL family transporter [Nocardioides coralli]